MQGRLRRQGTRVLSQRAPDGGAGQAALGAWPFAGPAWIREGEDVHLIDRWRHLGTVGNDADLQRLAGCGTCRRSTRTAIASCSSFATG
jgi:hypothetical protein